MIRPNVAPDWLLAGHTLPNQAKESHTLFVLELYLVRHSHGRAATMFFWSSVFHDIISCSKVLTGTFPHRRYITMLSGSSTNPLTSSAARAMVAPSTTR